MSPNHMKVESQLWTQKLENLLVPKWLPDRDLDGFPRPLRYVLLGEHTALLCRQEECGLANGETNGFVYIYFLDMF